MDTKALKVDVRATACPQVVPLLGPLNTAVISLRSETEEFIESEDGSVSSLGSYPASSHLPNPTISLKLPKLEPDHVYQHVESRLHDPSLSRLVSDQIVLQSQRTDTTRGPLFFDVLVKLTHKIYFLVPSTSSVASKTDLESETCAVCLENLSESETCQLPHCVHVFHERCLLQWSSRNNASCPLCRQSINTKAETLRA